VVFGAAIGCDYYQTVVRSSAQWYQTVNNCTVFGSVIERAIDAVWTLTQ